MTERCASSRTSSAPLASHRPQQRRDACLGGRRGSRARSRSAAGMSCSCRNTGCGLTAQAGWTSSISAPSTSAAPTTTASHRRHQRSAWAPAPRPPAQRSDSVRAAWAERVGAAAHARAAARPSRRAGRGRWACCAYGPRSRARSRRRTARAAAVRRASGTQALEQLEHLVAARPSSWNSCSRLRCRPALGAPRRRRDHLVDEGAQQVARRRHLRPRHAAGARRVPRTRDQRRAAGAAAPRRSAWWWWRAVATPAPAAVRRRRAAG